MVRGGELRGDQRLCVLFGHRCERPLLERIDRDDKATNHTRSPALPAYR